MTPMKCLIPIVVSLILALCTQICAGATVKTFDTLGEFKTRVIDSSTVWLILFDDGSSTSAEQHTFDEVATVLKGIVNTASIDVREKGQKEIADALNLSTFPKIFTLGKDKMKPVQHTGEIEPQALLQSAVSAVAKTVEGRARERWVVQDDQQQSTSGGQMANVVNLNPKNFQQKVLDNRMVGMVAFVAPWCGHCKALLPEWGQASLLLEGEAYLGVVDATVETDLAADYNVEGFPTIKIFPGGKVGKSPSDAIDYNGGRTKEDIVRAALTEVDRTGIPKPIPELVDGSGMKSCEGTNKICLLAALPHINESSAAKRNEYKETLTAVSKHFRGAAFQIFWFEGGSQPDLEEALEFTFGNPAVAALSVDKGAYAVMRKSFSQKSISLFLRGIVSGQQATLPLRKKTLTIRTVEPWDGKDVEIPLAEEEFSLEDIMGDDDEVIGNGVSQEL